MTEREIGDLREIVRNTGTCHNDPEQANILTHDLIEYSIEFDDEFEVSDKDEHLATPEQRAEFQKTLETTARNICKACPAISQCVRLAVREDSYGITGNKNWKERRIMRANIKRTTGEEINVEDNWRAWANPTIIQTRKRAARRTAASITLASTGTSTIHNAYTIDVIETTSPILVIAHDEKIAKVQPLSYTLELPEENILNTLPTGNIIQNPHCKSNAAGLVNDAFATGGTFTREDLAQTVSTAITEEDAINQWLNRLGSESKKATGQTTPNGHKIHALSPTAAKLGREERIKRGHREVANRIITEALKKQTIHECSPGLFQGTQNGIRSWIEYRQKTSTE